MAGKTAIPALRRNGPSPGCDRGPGTGIVYHDDKGTDTVSVVLVLGRTANQIAWIIEFPWKALLQSIWLDRGGVMSECRSSAIETD